MKKHIVLISPHAAMVDCALYHNLIITIIDKVENAGNYVGLTDVQVFLYDFQDADLSKKLLSSINIYQPIHAIVTLTEKSLRIAAELSAFFDLPGLAPNVIEIIHDKNEMRKFLCDKGNFSVKYCHPGNIKELSVFAESAGYPIIVKPVDGYGSQNVKKINSIDEFEEVDFSIELIAEEFLYGDEFSAECFSFKGKHLVAGITRKILIESSDGKNFTEMGHCVPANLTDEVKNLIETYIGDFLTLIGVDNGPTHTEFKLEGNKISIIETHNRIGGDRISSLVKMSTGIDLVELSMLWPLGLCSATDKVTYFTHHAAIRFFNPPPGKLISIAGIERLKHSSNVIDIEIGCKSGDIIKPIEDSFNRYGFVITTGRSEEEAITNSIESAKKLKFLTV